MCSKNKLTRCISEGLLVLLLLVVLASPVQVNAGESTILSDPNEFVFPQHRQGRITARCEPRNAHQTRLQLFDIHCSDDSAEHDGLLHAASDQALGQDGSSALDWGYIETDYLDQVVGEVDGEKFHLGTSHRINGLNCSNMVQHPASNIALIYRLIFIALN